jgi:transcriptional regulator with XRE-family HTH domain
MAQKDDLRVKILNFTLATHKEICRELGRRLKGQRLLKNIKQQDLADRAGLAVGTVKNLEAKGQTSLETLVRVAMVLDLVHELEPLFLMQVNSIHQMEQLEKLHSLKRRRAR